MTTSEEFTSKPGEPVEPDEPIENLNLPRRALTCLHKAGILTISQLSTKAYRDMWRMKNCGKYTVRDIDKALKARGITLHGDYYDLGPWCPKNKPRKSKDSFEK